MATTAPWIGGRSPSRSVPSRPTRTTASSGWSRNEVPAVKYISSEPGIRRLTLPCPFAEMAPLATTRDATSTTRCARSLSMTPPPSALLTIHPRACGEPEADAQAVGSGTALGEDAELVALRVGQDDPALIALTDIGSSSTEGEQ